jgi:ribosomal protein S18 acetylase RimI-like enzyme
MLWLSWSSAALALNAFSAAPTASYRAPSVSAAWAYSVPVAHRPVASLRRSALVHMAVSSKIKDVVYEAADVKSLKEVSTFFVDAFWLASTTFPGIELSAADKRQLTTNVAEDLGSRYGILSNDKRPTMMGGRKGFPSKCLFESRLIVAREPGGKIIGCAGVEAALYERSRGQVFRAVAADDLIRTELSLMSDLEAEVASDAYKAFGVGGLASGIIQKQFQLDLSKTFLEDFTPCALLANFAVEPAFRRSGLGRALCEECVDCTTNDWRMDEMALQVEASNTAAFPLYQSDGYTEVFRNDDAVALRLQPSEPSPFSALPGPFSALAPENKNLLEEIRSPTITMSKKIVPKKAGV